MNNWTEADIQAHLEKLKAPLLSHAQPVPSPPKAQGRIRQPKGQNKTEAAYDAHLATEQRIGAVLWYRFECIKLRIGENCHVTIDFFVMGEDGVLEAHDTKGCKKMKRISGEIYGKPYIEEDARIKLRAIAEMYPFRVKAVYFYEGIWQCEEF